MQWYSHFFNLLLDSEITSPNVEKLIVPQYYKPKSKPKISSKKGKRLSMFSNAEDLKNKFNSFQNTIKKESKLERQEDKENSSFVEPGAVSDPLNITFNKSGNRSLSKDCPYKDSNFTNPTTASTKKRGERKLRSEFCIEAPNFLSKPRLLNSNSKAHNSGNLMDKSTLSKSDITTPNKTTVPENEKNDGSEFGLGVSNGHSTDQVDIFIGNPIAIGTNCCISGEI